MKNINIDKVSITACWMGFLTVAIMLNISCRKNDHMCTERYPEPRDPVEKEHLWMIRHQVGDTLRMKVYKVVTVKDSGYARNYVPIGEETYIATDSAMESVTDADESATGVYCNDIIHLDRVFINFSGPSELKCGLRPRRDDDILDIFFRGEEFRTENIYSGENAWAHKEMTIGGKVYKDVNLFTGRRDWFYNQYVDSTVVFYNYDYGILRFILNDTLVYERDPH